MTFILCVALVVNALLIRAAVGFLNAPVDYKWLPPDDEVAIAAETTPTPKVSNESATGENPYRAQSPIPADQSTGQANPYAAPAVSAGAGSIPSQAPPPHHGVPSPSFAKAAGMALLQGIAISFLNALINAIPDNVAPDLPWLELSLLVLSFLATSAIYSQMLPTSFGKAALVFVLQILLTATVAVPVIMISCLFFAFV